MFSPYYAWARARGAGDPYQHCAINVALYGKGGKRWTMTERGRDAVTQQLDRFTVGPSSLSWDGQALTIAIEEVSVPIPSRVRGTVRLVPRAITDTQVRLDDAGGHFWWPIAPMADVEVAFDKPRRTWCGTGYFDSNWGAQPLEDAFRYWTWSRADTPDGSVVLYDVDRRNGADLAVALAFDRAGKARTVDSPPKAALPGTGWRIRRETRADADLTASVRATLEDTPFYARSVVETTLNGTSVTAMHESLSLDRFASKWVQVMLPFKMPRVSI